MKYFPPNLEYRRHVNIPFSPSLLSIRRRAFRRVLPLFSPFLFFFPKQRPQRRLRGPRWVHSIMSQAVRPAGAARQQHNVNTSRPRLSFWLLFEVERGPLFPITYSTSQTRQLNSHKHTEGSVFYCCSLLKKRSEVLRCDLWGFFFHPSSS